MSKSTTMLDSIRFILLIALVFFVAAVFSGLILGPIITALFYLFYRYYKRSKMLEKRLADLASGKTEGQEDAPPPSAIPPPPSTDA
jgi:predicted PurR-regulated permease PerM